MRLFNTVFLWTAISRSYVSLLKQLIKIYFYMFMSLFQNLRNSPSGI